MADDPRVCAAARAAIDTYGTSVSASRIASGERPFHRALERDLAALTGAEDALVFVSGFGTNETVISHLLGPGDLIVHDDLIHSSVLQGALASGARRMDFRHNDLDDLEQLLSRNRRQYHQCLIVVEGLYSMDGDIPDLSRLVAIKDRHHAALMVDEAHSVGVLGETGRGLAEFCGVDAGAVELWMGTLSKSLASCGGYIAGAASLIEYLRYSVPGFVYSVGITPANAAAANAALEIMRREPDRVTRLHLNADSFLAKAHALGLETGLEQAYAVVPVMVGDEELAVRLSAALLEQGVDVQAAIFPAVPEGQARLRFFITSEHSAQQIDEALTKAAHTLAELRLQQGG
ncbi:MAG: aminotransferase class I/II-fold pyridoxal phosphate-dependent enzyme [Sedimenticola sp.]